MRLGAELELTKGRDSWLSARLRKFFETSYDRDRIAVNSRLKVLEREYLFGLDRLEGLDLTIDLYGNGRGMPVPDYVITDMVSVCNGRVIDRGKLVPQNGFGREITREEIEEALAIPGAVLVVLSLDGLRVGFYLLLTECEAYPEYVKRVMALCAKTGITRRARTGWLEYVVLEEAASERISAHGLSGYGLMHWAGCAIAADAQAKHVLLSVRSGPLANTAIRQHDRRGLYRLGLEVTPETMDGFSTDPATIMKCDLYSLERADWYASSAATHDRGVRF